MVIYIYHIININIKESSAFIIMTYKLQKKSICFNRVEETHFTETRGPIFRFSDSLSLFTLKLSCSKHLLHRGSRAEHKIVTVVFFSVVFG